MFISSTLSSLEFSNCDEISKLIITFPKDMRNSKTWKGIPLAMFQGVKIKGKR